MISRRHFLTSTAAASIFYAGFPARGYAQTRELGKIAVIILEGGMDGLTAVPPIGDDSLKKQRRNLVSSAPIALNPFFGLHQNLKFFSGLLASNEAAIIHATSIPYVLRSHFEGQNLMQSGGHTPFESQTGWLGRAMELAGIPGKALALDMPLLIRGGEDLDNLYPASIRGTDNLDAGTMNLLARYHEPELAEVFGKLEMRAVNIDLEARRRDPTGLAFTAGQQMARPGGPNVSVIRLTEFDTHFQQGTDDGKHPELLTLVDEIFRSYKLGLGDAWQNSIVLTLTEFGRTVKENGSAGTDHGYGTAGLLAGGLLKKSSVIANWPGLAEKDLFEGRDLAATLDYRAVCAACIEAAFGIPHDEITERVFGERKLPHIHQLIFAGG